MDGSKPTESARNANLTWAVYRQGDDGNKFLVESYLTEEEAERLVAVFEARGHKQVYWAEPERR